jgi:hypothetical protein
MTDGREFATRVSLGALFTAFLKVSLCGFGGGLVWARRITVEQRQWISVSARRRTCSEVAEKCRCFA